MCVPSGSAVCILDKDIGQCCRCHSERSILHCRHSERLLKATSISNTNISGEHGTHGIYTTIKTQENRRREEKKHTERRKNVEATQRPTNRPCDRSTSHSFFWPFVLLVFCNRHSLTPDHDRTIESKQNIEKVTFFLRSPRTFFALVFFVVVLSLFRCCCALTAVFGWTRRVLCSPRCLGSTSIARRPVRCSFVRSPHVWVVCVCLDDDTFFFPSALCSAELYRPLHSSMLRSGRYYFHWLLVNSFLNWTSPHHY